MDNLAPFPNIETLIPHRPPIIVVDKVVAMKGLETKTSFAVKEDCIFVEHGVFSEMGMIENIAQTSFVFLNYYFSEKKQSLFADGRETLGFISNITEMEVFSRPRIGDVLLSSTVVELVFASDFLNICNIEGEITVNGETMLLAKMKMLVKTQDT